VNETFTSITQFLLSPLKISKIIWDYKHSLFYVTKKRGLCSACKFLFAKITVADEGGEISFLDPLYREFPSLCKYPYKIEVEMSSICLRMCLLCEHTYWDEKDWQISFKEFVNLIDQFPNLRWINTTGEGSAFLNKDFYKILQYLRNRDISVNFVDEFEYINERWARRIIDLGITCIWISMDGATKETYESIKVGCNYDKIVNNIIKFGELKREMKTLLPTLCFRYIVNKLNVHEVPDFVDKVASFNVLGEGSRVEFAGLLTFPEIEHLYMWIPPSIKEEAIRRGKKYDVHITFAHTSELPSPQMCAAWCEPYVMMEGFVVSCCAVMMSNRREFLRKYAFGNINEQSFEEIWSSERYKKFRQMVTNKSEKVPILCAGCRAYDMSEREKKYGVSEEV